MDSKTLSSAVANFAVKFCNVLDKNKNVVSSPLSAETLLALLTLGSTEPAHSELLTALGLPDDESIRSAFTTLSSDLKSVKGITLNVANKVYFMDKGYKLHSELEKDAIKVFDVGFEKVDFSDGVAAAGTINGWVEDKTNKRIKDLLSPDDFNDFTRLVLVNAIYFKGTWSQQFDPHLTKARDFHVSSTEKLTVDMMYRKDDFNYGESAELGAKLLELTYLGEAASMLIVLPNEIDGLDAVLKKLADGYDLMNDVNKMYSTEIHVSLPKFKIETKIDLKELLPQLGIKAIFDDANSGLTKLLDCDEEVFVSKAVQKAFIEVNEEGVEAAAATGMMVALRCAMMMTSFTADHPFLYILLGPGRTAYFIGVFRATE